MAQLKPKYHHVKVWNIQTFHPDSSKNHLVKTEKDAVLSLLLNVALKFPKSTSYIVLVCEYMETRSSLRSLGTIRRTRNVNIYKHIVSCDQ